MCSKRSLDELLNITGRKLRDVFGDKLDRVILYGSYARGDYDDESDIDVMALVDMDRNELSKYRRKVSSFAGDIDLEYDVLLSLKLQDKDTFDKYGSTLPFYKNVIRDGVIVNV